MAEGSALNLLQCTDCSLLVGERKGIWPVKNPVPNILFHTNGGSKPRGSRLVSVQMEHAR